MRSIIYLHGFNSSPHSAKAQIIQAYFQKHHCDVVCHIPTLSIEPAHAIEQVSDIIVKSQAQGENPTLMGSSLGGFYATYLSQQFGLKAVLINPAVAAHQLLVDHVGEQTHFHTGERYQFTTAYLEQLQWMNVEHISQPENFFVLLQAGDEVLDYQQAIALFSRSSLWVSGGGSHAFDHIEQTIPAVLNFLHHAK